MGFLIDTSIFVAWERGVLAAEDIEAQAGEHPLALSAVTASELLHGVHRANSAQRRGRRSAFVESVLSTLPVLPFDLRVSRLHAEVWADLRHRGEMVGAHDLMIAATALSTDYAVATRNTREFARVEGLKVATW